MPMLNFAFDDRLFRVCVCVCVFREILVALPG